MLNINTIEQILSSVQSLPRSKALVDLPVYDGLYLSWLQGYATNEITPDIILFGWVDALQENKYVLEVAPDFAAAYWMIGRTGSGDEWFICLKQSSISLYDHNNGGYSEEGLIHLRIDFTSFLQLADLLRQLDQHLDAQDIEEAELKDEFNRTTEKISSGLSKRYPFDIV